MSKDKKTELTERVTASGAARVSYNDEKVDEIVTPIELYANTLLDKKQAYEIHQLCWKLRVAFGQFDS